MAPYTIVRGVRMHGWLTVASRALTTRRLGNLAMIHDDGWRPSLRRRVVAGIAVIGRVHVCVRLRMT